MERLFTPCAIGNVKLKNRVVFAPTSLGGHGLELYREIAAGGTGLVILPDVSVQPSMLGAPSLDSGWFFPYFRQVLYLCRKEGCEAAPQLFFPEYDLAYVGGLFRNRQSLGAEEVRRKMAENVDGYCDSLSETQAEEIIARFGAAAKYAAAAGFRLVQIHGDRLLGSFSSAVFNHRTDRYGKRTAFPAAVVRAVKEAAPELAVDYKLTVRTEEPRLGRGGVAIGEVPEFVRALEEAGADSFHVAAANHSNLRDTIPAANHPFLRGEGCFSHLGEAVLNCASKPVCLVGKIQHGAFAEGLVERGYGFVGLSRQLIADPQWPNKVRAGREEEIRYCVYCNQKCVGGLMSHKPVGCVLRQETEG